VENRIIPSIILAAGFIGGVALLGNQLGDGVNALLNKDRIVTVKGLCEKEVKANHVIWPLSFNEMGNDLVTVYDNLEKKQSTVFEFLKKGGIDPSEISLAAPKVNDTLANSYGPNRSDTSLLRSSPLQQTKSMLPVNLWKPRESS